MHMNSRGTLVGCVDAASSQLSIFQLHCSKSVTLGLYDYFDVSACKTSHVSKSLRISLNLIVRNKTFFSHNNAAVVSKTINKKHLALKFNFVSGWKTRDAYLKTLTRSRCAWNSFRKKCSTISQVWKAFDAVSWWADNFPMKVGEFVVNRWRDRPVITINC